MTIHVLNMADKDLIVTGRQSIHRHFIFVALVIVSIVVSFLCFWFSQAVIKTVVRRYIFERLLTSVVPSEGPCVKLFNQLLWYHVIRYDR